MDGSTNLSDLDTPQLILDRGKTQKNISRMHRRMKNLGVNLRPHGKTAKNVDVMKMALDGQAGGITVSTLKEAEYYFGRGIVDIVYAVGIVPAKMDRIAALVKRGARVTVILDSVEHVKLVAARAIELGVEVPALIELDCDGHRSGVTLNGPDLLDIGRSLGSEEGISLAGVLTHGGESYNCKSTDEIAELANVERDCAAGAAHILREAGLPCDVVSVGSTPTANFAKSLDGVSEVRAGVFMFYDLVMAGLGVCEVDDIALSVLTTVIGHQKEKGWLITDAGWMALSQDRGTATQEIDQGYGLVCDLAGTPIPELIVSSTNQEHGIVTHRSGKILDGAQFPIGTMLRIFPNHACATAASHNKYHVTDGGSVIIDVWERVNGW